MFKETTCNARASPQQLLKELRKRTQHCCATLRRSLDKRNDGSCLLRNCLTNFKICAATPTTQNTKHHATEFMAVKMSRKRSGFVIYSYIKDSAFLELKRDANF